MSGRPVVLKLGGRVAAGAVRAALAGIDGPVVVVHGAGPQITAEMERRGIEPSFVDGRRVTTPAVLDVVRESLAAVNAELCSAIGPRALGLRGDDRTVDPAERRADGAGGDAAAELEDDRPAAHVVYSAFSRT